MTRRTPLAVVSLPGKSPDDTDSLLDPRKVVPADGNVEQVEGKFPAYSVTVPETKAK